MGSDPGRAVSWLWVGLSAAAWGARHAALPGLTTPASTQLLRPLLAHPQVGLVPCHPPQLQLGGPPTPWPRAPCASGF